MRDWSMARGRMETEIQRRKEHLNEATNFEKARGFVRTNWKTKNWNPEQDPTQMDSSTDSEDEATIYKDERRDTVKDALLSPSSKGFEQQEELGINTDYQDNFGLKTESQMRSSKLWLSDSKEIKKLYNTKPVVEDFSDSLSEPSTMATVQEQLDTLNAIKGYNKALKPARKVKDALPEITCSNIAFRDRFVKDPKKGKVSVERSYNMIGILDGGERTPQNPNQFSITAK